MIDFKNLFRKKEAGKHPLYDTFMTWQMHGIGDDVLIDGLRPEYKQYVAKARLAAGPNATDESVLAALEAILQELKA